MALKKRYNISKKNLKKQSNPKYTLKKDLKKKRQRQRQTKTKYTSKKDLKKQSVARGLQMLNIGSTNTTIRNNDKITNSSIKWSGDYDGKLANIHVAVDDNGRKEDMDIKLTNDDLTQLLGYPAVEKQLDMRLFDDFLSNREPIYFRGM